MHADEQTNEILIFQGCKASSRSGQVAHSRSHSLCWVGPAEEAAPTVGRGREEGSLSSPVLVGETMDMPLSALDMSIDMADAGELNPGFLSQVHAGGGVIFLTLQHVPYLISPGARSLAAVQPCAKSTGASGHPVVCDTFHRLLHSSRDRELQTSALGFIAVGSLSDKEGVCARLKEPKQ